LDNLNLAVLTVWNRLLSLGERSEGFTTAELIGNAALAIVALIAIWAVLQKLGVGVVNNISKDLGVP
jgi:hypothetical protein